MIEIYAIVECKVTYKDGLTESCIEDLEMDLIIKLGQKLNLPTKNTKFKKVLSGSFF